MQSIYLVGYPYTTPIQIHSNISDLGFVVNIPVEGFEFPEIRLAKYDKPGEHGGIVTNQFYGGRSFALNGRIASASVTQYNLNRRTLELALSIIQDSLAVARPILVQFQTMDGLLLQAYAFASKAPIITDKSVNHASFRLEFYAPDENFYGQSLQMATLSIPSGGGVQYPVIYPVSYAAQTGGQAVVTNSGNAPSFPVITFTGPLTSPFINNLTTGQTFLINLTLGASDVLVVDMANKTMLLNGNTNALPYFDNGNSWVYLAAGANTIRLGSGLSSDTGNAVVAYRDAYLGV